MSSTTSADRSRADLTKLDKPALEVELLKGEVEKLWIEVEAMRASTFWDRTIGRYLPLATALVAVGGFFYGVHQYHDQRKSAEEDMNKNLKEAVEKRTDELKREAAKPFWDAQLQQYLRASEAAATVATTEKEDVGAKAEAEFWILYWGPLAAVEDVGTEKNAIEQAMVKFGDYLKKSPKNRDKHTMELLSLGLAHAIREEVGPAFSLKSAAPLGDRRK